MTYECLLVETRERVATVTLNRPQGLNALNKHLIGELRDAMRALAADGGVRAVLLTGAGRGFCSGADLMNAGFDDGVKRGVGEGVAHSMEIAYNPLVRDLASFPKPLIAAVNGVAAGGGVGLALSADIVVAARSASFVQVFGPRLGLLPDMGCTWYLPRLVGRARARGLALLGDKLSAEQAAQWGLIWAVFDDSDLLAQAFAIAERLSKGPPKAFSQIKHALDIAMDNGLDEQLEHERRVQGVLGDTADFREGVTAFAGKREPKFTGA
jgi:2-(1,2-epoxy-1,2-dihydrophenyl)acetyl-CoA isomerase